MLQIFIAVVEDYSNSMVDRVPIPEFSRLEARTLQSLLLFLQMSFFRCRNSYITEHNLLVC